MNKKKRKVISEIIEQLEGLMSEVESLRDEESGSYENLPEGIKLSEMGEKMSESAGNLEEAAGCFEELIGYLVGAKGEQENEEEKTDK
jgi:hypothetical protein